MSSPDRPDRVIDLFERVRTHPTEMTPTSFSPDGDVASGDPGAIGTESPILPPISRRPRKTTARRVNGIVPPGKTWRRRIS